MVFALGQIPALAQTPQTRSIQVSATVSRTPPAIQLSWPALSQARASYQVYRKARFAKSWGMPILALPATATNCTDGGVASGDAYEYMIIGSSANGTTNYATYGFIYAGLDAPMIDRRGKMILVVDNTYAAALDAGLSRLQQDLVGDGWAVIRHDVSRTQSVVSVKELIQSDYRADSNSVKSVLLFGHVPVPYSGNTASVTHEDNIGAAEADVFYADMDGVWTDTLVNHTGTSFDNPRLNNVPGDGRYDQSELPSDTELQIGRVDLSSMPSFPQGEQALLQNYLNKDHDFRCGVLQTPRKGIVSDADGDGNGTAAAAAGFRNFTAFFGATNVLIDGYWFNGKRPVCLWGGAWGSGSHNGNSAMGNTPAYTTNEPNVVFTLGFGSYMGDWDYSDDLMKAVLCTATYGLGCLFGDPHAYLHTMALGDTVGAAAWLTQNYDGLLYPDTDRTDGPARGKASRGVWINWLGDPSLRLNPVMPPSGLAACATDATTITLNWSASPDTGIQGYGVYRSPGFGSFTNLTSALLTGTTCTDSAVAAGTYTYMVRAVKLETNGSGTYYNPSQGIFQTVRAGSGTPAVAIVSPMNGATYYPGATITLRANVSTDYTGSVVFYSGDVALGAASTAPYAYQWNNAATGLCTLTAQATNANGTTVSQPVTVSILPLPAALPAPWLQADIGATGLPGSATNHGAGLTNGYTIVNGSGTGFAGSADALHIVYQPLNEEGVITARITAVQSPASAGLFIRDNLLPNSQGAAVLLSSSGTVTFCQRLTGAATTATTTDATRVSFPYWLKLARDGDTISACGSSNGSAWTTVGTSVAVPMGSTPAIGLAVFSGSPATSCAATFTNVGVASPLRPPIVWFRTPCDGAAFTLGAAINVQIEKPSNDEPDSYFTGIAFFDGATQIGATSTARNVTWTPATPGVHTVTALVVDHFGLVGSNSLMVTINPAGSLQPAVAITNPIDGKVFAAPCDVALGATAQPAGSATVTRVDFYANGMLIVSAPAAPCSVTWTNVQAGVYRVTARAVDSAGVVTQSQPVFLYFFDRTRPRVSLANPADGATYVVPANVALGATACTDAGAIGSVEFYQGGTLLQSVTNPPYACTWKQTAAGNYSLRAMATDNAGTAGTSTTASVRIDPLLISGVVRNPSLTLSATSSVGAVYSLQYMTNLITGNWQDVAGQTSVPGTGGNVSLVDTNVPAITNRFYRIASWLP